MWGLVGRVLHTLVWSGMLIFLPRSKSYLGSTSIDFGVFESHTHLYMAFLPQLLHTLIFILIGNYIVMVSIWIPCTSSLQMTNGVGILCDLHLKPWAWVCNKTETLSICLQCKAHNIIQYDKNQQFAINEFGQRT